MAEQQAEEIAALQQRLAELEQQRQHQQPFAMDELVAALRQPNAETRVKPPTFDGKRDVRKFLTTFEEVRDVNNWNPRQTALQLKMALDSRVAETVQGDDYQAMRNFLLQRYELTTDEARRQLKVARPKKGENIYDFGDHILVLVKLKHPTMELEQQEQIATEELIDSVGDWVLRREFRNRPAEHFGDALRRVHEYNCDRGENTAINRLQYDTDGDLAQKVIILESKLQKVSTRQDTMEQTLLTKMNDLETSMMKGIHELTDVIKKNQITAPQTISTTQLCYYCNKGGHYKRDCHKRARDEHQSGNASGPSN